MTIRQIVASCKQILNVACDSLEACAAADGNVTEPEKTDVELANCCNFVLEELYCDYASSIHKTVVEATNNYVDVSGIGLNKVVSLQDCYGNNVKFRYTENGLYVGDGSYNLVYTKLPPKYGFDDEVTLPSPRITYRILIYGVLAEYLGALGDYEASKAWNEKYRAALRSSVIKASGQYLPKRRWV